MYKVHIEHNQSGTPQLPQDIRKTNKRVSFSTGVIPTTSVSKLQLKSNQFKDIVMLNNSQGKKQQVADHHRNFKFSNNKMSVTACNDSLNAKNLTVNFVCVTCGKCMLNNNYDTCVLHYMNDVNSRTKQPIAMPISAREPKQTVNQSVATSFKKTVATDSTVKKPRNITRNLYEHLIEIILFIVDFGCSKHMTRNLKLLPNFVEKFLGTVKFRNNQIAPILGYGDLAEAIATACFTQNRSLVIRRHEKTPYHIINGRKPSVKFFYIFGSLCYIVKDGENLNKMKEKVVSKSSTVNAIDSPNQHQQKHTTPFTSTIITEDTPPLNIQTTPKTTCQEPTQAPTVTATKNINQGKMITENAQVEDDEFINIFCTPLQEQGETSSRHVDSSNMHTFYQQHHSKHRWTKDHLLKQVIRNPSQSIRTRRQLETDDEMFMFVLTVSRTEPKNKKEAMADSVWIESMQEELRQFARLVVWELVDIPLCKNVINMKWIWKNKRDEENTVIHKKLCLVAKGYAQKEGIDFE
nr:Gag-Pol polyprotein [Tanacetum cinerariifolium]